MMHPVGSPLKRMIDPEPNGREHFPNVFMLTESLLNGKGEYYSPVGKNMMFVHFGLFVLNDILDSGGVNCPPSYKKIAYPDYVLNEYGHKVNFTIPAGHSKYALINHLEQFKDVQHSVNNFAHKVNQRSVWIDGEIIYGNTKYCADSMRTFEKGMLMDFEADPDSHDHPALHCFNRKI